MPSTGPWPAASRVKVGAAAVEVETVVEAAIVVVKAVLDDAVSVEDEKLSVETVEDADVSVVVEDTDVSVEALLVVEEVADITEVTDSTDVADAVSTEAVELAAEAVVEEASTCSLVWLICRQIRNTDQWHGVLTRPAWACNHRVRGQ